MEVILLERVEKLGGIGDVVKVKNGFARNYLLPNKKALRANEANRALFEANRARIEAENETKRADAEKAAKGVDGKTVQLIRQASNTGHLYGSVSARDIVEALEGQGAKIGQEPGRARPTDQGDRPSRGEGCAALGGRGDDQGERRPFAREADLQAQGIDVLDQMFEREAAPAAAEELEAIAETEESAEAAAEAPAEETAEVVAESPAEETPAAEADDQQS